MKNFLLEKGVVICTIFFSIHSSQQLPPKVESIREDRVINKTLSNPIASLVAKDRQIMEEYNASVKKKNEINNKVLSLSKKETENTKLINKLILDVTTKAENRDKKGCTSIVSDTICTKYRKPLFGNTKKCVEKEVSYYLIENNKKELLQTIKINPRVKHTI